MLVYFLAWHGNYCFESTCIICYKSFYLITHLTSFSNTTLWCDQECVSLLLILWSLISFLLLYFVLPNSATTPHFLIKQGTTVKVEYYFALATNKRHVRLKQGDNFMGNCGTRIPGIISKQILTRSYHFLQKLTIS